MGKQAITGAEGDRWENPTICGQVYKDSINRVEGNDKYPKPESIRIVEGDYLEVELWPSDIAEECSYLYIPLKAIDVVRGQS